MPANSPPTSIQRSAQNNNFKSLGVVLLFLGVLRTSPHLLAEIPQTILPAPVVSQSQTNPATETSGNPSGNVSKASFEEKYKDSVVMLLINKTEVTVNEDWSSSTYVHLKILVQTKAGAAFGEIPINYRDDTEEVRIVKAVTITPDGKEHPRAKVQDISIYDGDGMYSNAKRKIVFMPEVGVGSTIDLEYVKTTKQLSMPRAFWNIDNLNSELPIKKMAMIYRMPEKLNVRFKGFKLSQKPVILHKDGVITYQWERNNVEPEPADEEELTPSPVIEDFKNGFEFSSIKSWQDIAVWYYRLIQKNLHMTPQIRKAAKKAAKGKTSVRDKTRAILEYLQENFRYVSMSFGGYDMEPHPTDEVFRNKYGDCKDQSLLMKAMLEAVGIRADFALFLAENDGNDPSQDLPVPGLFDHALLKIRDSVGGDFYADPLLVGYDIKEYPLAYQAAYTLLIHSEGAQFDRLPVFDEKQNSQTKNYVIEIHPDGSARNVYEYLWDLSDSISTRMKMKASNAEQKKQFYDEALTSLAGEGKALEMTLAGLDQKYGPLKYRSVTEQPHQYPLNDGLIVIDLPQAERLVTLTQKIRKAPIFFPMNGINHMRGEYKLPEGFEVIHLPKGFEVTNGFYSYRRKIEMTGRVIKVSEVKQLRRIQLPAADYPTVKAFYDKLPSLTEQRIILKKTSETSVPFPTGTGRS